MSYVPIFWQWYSFIFFGIIGPVYLVVKDYLLQCNQIAVGKAVNLTNQLFHNLSPLKPSQSCQDGAGHKEVFHSKRQIYTQLHSDVGKETL